MWLLRRSISNWWNYYSQRKRGQFSSFDYCRADILLPGLLATLDTSLSRCMNQRLPMERPRRRAHYGRSWAKALRDTCLCLLQEGSWEAFLRWSGGEACYRTQRLKERKTIKPVVVPILFAWANLLIQGDPVVFNPRPTANSSPLTTTSGFVETSNHSEDTKGRCGKGSLLLILFSPERGRRVYNRYIHPIQQRLFLQLSRARPILQQ